MSVAAPSVTATADVPKKTAREMFSSSVNPFGPKSGYVVTRSADFRRIAALPRRETWADQSEALTLLFALPPRKPGTCPPRCPCQGTGKMSLWPRQAWALTEFYEQRGGIGLLGVGSGKTLLSALLPQLMGWERPILLVPAGLRNKTLNIDFPLLARHWRMPPAEGPGSLEVMAYETLSRDYDDYLATKKIPDGIVADELHALKNRGSGRTKKISRFFGQFPETEFCGMSGSVVHSSVMDYGHLMNFALKDTSPLPHSFIELKTWADVLDADIPDFARPEPGALWDLCRAGETIRDGYRRRLLDTAGVISSSDLSTSIGLQVLELEAPQIPADVLEAFHVLRNTGTMPDGEMCTTKLDQVRHARELFLGYYLRWVWPGGKPDVEWLKRRRAWRKYVRKMTTRSHGGRWYDTEKQVADAVLKGEVVCSEVELTVQGKILRTNVNVYAEWVEIREDRKKLWKSKEPPKEIVWLSDYMLVELERWAKRHVGIVWVENIGFLDALRARAKAGSSGATASAGGPAGCSWPGHGLECFGAGENDVELVSGKHSIFASLAHSVGKNLQMFNRMCFSNPLSSGKAWEQALGREHRPGCRGPDGKLADDVIAEVYLGCRETWWSFERAKLQARYIEATLGQPQRLNKATIVSPTDDDAVVVRLERGDPLWAQTGHAKIDGKLGRVGPDGVRAESATPLLTALKKQAKQSRVQSHREGVTERSIVDLSFANKPNDLGSDCTTTVLSSGTDEEDEEDEQEDVGDDVVDDE